MEISGNDPFAELSRILNEETGNDDEPLVARLPECPARLLDNNVEGIAATYVSKVLRFALPAQYGAIDSRLVRVFGKGDSISGRHDWLPLTATQSRSGGAIRERDWPKGYGIWINILRYFASKLSDNCPHPESFYRNELRQNGIWTCADVEMALFSYATAAIGAAKAASTKQGTARKLLPISESSVGVSAVRYPNRRQSCPQCGANVGEACHYPSSFVYPQGHRARGRSSDQLSHSNRQYPCPKCEVGVGEVCHYPSGYRYEQGHKQRPGKV